MKPCPKCGGECHEFTHWAAEDVAEEWIECMDCDYSAMAEDHGRDDLQHGAPHE